MSMFENLKGLAALMGQSGQLKEKYEQLQAELDRITVEADAGAGAVRVVMNGRMQVLSVKLDHSMLATLAGEGDEADQGMIEQLVAGAFNAALAKTQDVVRAQVSELTAGVNSPGIEQMLSGSGP